MTGLRGIYLVDGAVGRVSAILSDIHPACCPARNLASMDLKVGQNTLKQVMCLCREVASPIFKTGATDFGMFVV